MKVKIIILLIILLLIGLKGYQLVIRFSSFRLDESDFAILSTKNGIYNYLKRGYDFQIKLDDRFAGFFAQSIFLINEKLACLVVDDSIYYRNFENGKEIRKLDVQDYSLAINKNEKGDLILFSGGNLYEYNFSEDKLKILKENLVNLEKVSHSIYYPSLYIHPNKIAYSKNRNSVFYAAYIDVDKRITGIYEMSLDDYSVELRGKGFCPQVNDEKNALYYISADKSKIIKSNLNNFKEKVLLAHKYNFRDMVVINEKTIFFVHASAIANLKGVRFDNFKIYKDGKVRDIWTRGSIYRVPFDAIKID
ncbi:hypothetical protein [Orenia marismortui]|uniref:Uncharacterized protein n=1 Tax=Orenia marismortui TaxID=46469 RepID=A0A4R8H3I5_9FIRM|nr:hypothetical protein [Orenia marismortui]TDX51144.1 hypothetical protein C7959_11520 [Orenia marismortui]